MLVVGIAAVTEPPLTPKAWFQLLRGVSGCGEEVGGGESSEMMGQKFVVFSSINQEGLQAGYHEIKKENQNFVAVERA